ncbi:MAG: thermonuclease family protein [archaeon]
MKPKPALLLSILITLLIASNIFIISHLQNPSTRTAVIERIIDGDTLQLKGGEIIRLENINTPEKNQPGYEEAKSFLKKFENTTIQVESTGLDKYKRTLAKIYTQDNSYINLEIISQGLANKYLVNDDEIKLFAEAEANAIKSQKGLWKKSSYSSCFSTQIFPKEEVVKIINYCPPINFNGWKLKDESRKKYNFPNIQINEINIHTKEGNDNETDLFQNQETEIWDNERDSLYLFDSENNLANHNSYGYYLGT